MSRTGTFRTNETIVAVTRSLPGNADKAKKTPQARVAPTGAENTALKTIASKAPASRTNPVLLRTNRPFSVDATGCPAGVDPLPLLSDTACTPPTTDHH